MKNKILTTTLIILIISVTFGGAMFGLNFLTAPFIEANNSGAEFGPLLAVMPEGAEFDGDALIYSSENASASTLTNVPENVLAIYREKNGLGFAVRATATSGYTSSPLVMSIGITAEGKICGIQINSYGDNSGSNWNKTILTNDYLGTYLGQDSALADVELIANPTSNKASSVAFKNAVEAAMGCLISNELITAGVKSDAQILKEYIPVAAPGLKMSESVAVSGNITEAYKALNNSGFAYIFVDGETTYLAVVNTVGVCELYTVVEGEVVVADNTAFVEEAQAHAAGNQKDHSTTLTNKLSTLMVGAENVTAVEFSTFNNVVYAVSFELEGATYYAFYSAPLTYDNNAMVIVTILDENGAIVKQDIGTILYGHGVEYMPVYGEGYGNPSSNKYNQYEGKFEGLTSGDLTDDLLITGATISSTAVKNATADVFAAFESIQGGNQ